MAQADVFPPGPPMARTSSPAAVTDPATLPKNKARPAYKAHSFHLPLYNSYRENLRGFQILLAVQ